jgi:SprB repeat/Secretion system C-terminal sorting domain
MSRKFTLIILFIAFSVISTTAQDGGTTTFTLKVREAFNQFGNRNTPTWVVNGTCVNRDGNGWMNFDQPVGVRYGNVQNDISVSVDSWQEDSDCGNRCVWEDGCNFFGNDSDDGRAQWNVFLNLSADNSDNNTSGYPVMPPGQFYNLPKDFMQSGYGLRLSVSYSTPQPKRPEIKENGASYTGRILCNTQQVTLEPLIHVNPIHHSQITYKWEYHIKGDSSNHTRNGRCLEWDYEFRPRRCVLYERIPYKLPIWKTYTDTNGGADGGKKTFSLNDIPELKNLTAGTQIFFRVTASANGSTSPFSTASIAVNVSQSAPTVLSSGISTLPSCSVLSSANGQINVSGVSSSFPTYLYLLKEGFNAALGCDPENPSSCLKPGSISGSTSGPNFSIPKVASGKYTLFLLNAAGSVGLCSTTSTNIEVSPIAPLSLPMPSITNVACQGSSSGAISFVVNTGKPDNVSHTLISASGIVLNQISTTAGAYVSFSSLSTGTYQLTSNDNCSLPVKQGNIPISQPAKVTITDLQFGAATCASPGNGTARIDVVKSADSPSSSQFHYRLLSSNGAIYKEAFLTESGFNMSNLPVDNYTVIAKEPGAQECNASVKGFSIIGPSPLAISSITPSNTLCYTSTDGTLSFVGNGGLGSYNYEITPSDGGPTLQNITGSFNGLTGGDYRLTLRSQIAGCADSYTHPTPATIGRPTKISALLDKKDISCNGFSNGKIIVNPSGGTPSAGTPYAYTWEKQTGVDWATLPNSGSSIADLSAGNYRVKVEDANRCKQTSASEQVIEPASLRMSNVVVNDIKCFGETGSITVMASGGTGSPIYQYSVDDGKNYNPLLTTTSLSAGTYKLKAVDQNGCQANGVADYSITTPPSELKFLHSLSDYNGVAISCFGGSNGSINISASGGNGASYSGYTYAIDNGSFKPNALFDKLYSGTYSVKVKDGRGCSAERSIFLSQSSEKINAAVKDKKDVVCAGDKLGIIEFQALGGIAPYQFILNNSITQSDGRFTGLKAGEYSLIVKDNNRCEATIKTSIISSNIPPQVATKILPVKCFGEKNGAIDFLLTGGSPPFKYSWTGSNKNSSSLSDLQAGVYKVKITDNAGCSDDFEIEVKQPDKLQMKLDVLPSCYNQNSGKVSVSAGGGIAPYKYAISGNNPYQDPPVFTSLRTGNYTVSTKDANDCVSKDDIQIIEKNGKSEPNFLVSTKRYASDTLVATEISVPKPDSVHWIFDPNIIVVKNDKWSPQILLKEAGKFVMSMTGYYGGCDYVITKTLTINPYDPQAVLIDKSKDKAIQEFEVFPNPSVNGNVTLSIKLGRKQYISVSIIDIMGLVRQTYKWDKVKEVNEAMVIDNIVTGLYVVRVITETDVRELRLIIN